MTNEINLRFRPSRVEGMPEVAEVVVYRDRLELLSAGRWVTIYFASIVRWPRPAWLRRLLARVGLRPHWLPVADRDWFHPPPDRFFAFYTNPRLVVYMPADDVGEFVTQGMFARVRDMIRAGGYNTCDLG